MKHVPKSEIPYVGPDLEAGPLPAFVYFSLTAEESLTLEPYNSPVVAMEDPRLRIFSFTLPAHGPGLDPNAAMESWAEDPAQLEPFVKKTADQIQTLCDAGWIGKPLGLGGLSRGGLIATWLAALLPQAQAVLGFAPVTEFHGISLKERIPQLTHLRALRFYMGNRDTRVSTDHCYAFIRAFADTIHAQRLRQLAVEMRITQSIGRDGHGTAPETFAEGALWMKHQLLGA